MSRNEVPDKKYNLFYTTKFIVKYRYIHLEMNLEITKSRLI